MIRTVIIDDDEKARESLSENIYRYCKNIEIVATATSVFSGLQVINEHKPELVFLDIEMPDGTGFDLLNKLEAPDFKLIFCTAFQKYAIKAFKFSAIDYLLKPIDPEDLIDAVERAENILKNENLELKLKTLNSHYSNKSGEKKKMVLKTQDQIHYISIEEILHCESDKNYTQFYLKDERCIVISRTLKEYEELLQDDGFYRVHQSHLVNLSQIVSYNKVKNRKRDKSLDNLGECEGYVTLKNHAKIPVSQRKRDSLLKLLSNY